MRIDCSILTGSSIIQPRFAPGPPERYRIWKAPDWDLWIVIERDGDKIYVKNTQL